MNEPIINFEADALTPSKGLFQERWDILKRNRRAYVSFWFLIVLFVLALLGKVFTQNIILFDPKIVRLSEKFLPPLTPFASTITPKEDAPLVGIYLLGTDELGRDVFARMVEGSFVSLTIGFVAVGIALTVGIFLVDWPDITVGSNWHSLRWIHSLCGLWISCCVFPVSF